MTTASIRSLGHSIEQIFPARSVELADICVFTNAPPMLWESWRPAYAARTAQPEDVSLIQLPPDCEVSGRAGFAARLGSCLIAEQLNRDDPAGLDRAIALFATDDDPIDVGPETVLIARYGEGTWGHWLVELLPKLALCEAAWPGRFHYAVPDWVLHGGLFSSRILESVAAYGVGVDRLIRIRSDQVVRFKQLFAVTPVYSSMIPHPDVLGVMGRPFKASQAQESKSAKIALLRHDNRRTIQNSDEVLEVLHDHDFSVVDIADQDFMQQMALFATNQTFFSVLGSSLSGLIFAPAGARIVTVAPEQFGDRFFYGIAQTRQATAWSEARGPVTGMNGQHYRDSSFSVPLTALEEALAVEKAGLNNNSLRPQHYKADTSP
jgi:hypothetical protein